MGQPFSGRVVHLELHTQAQAAARDFYTALCGWQAEEVRTSAGSYLALEVGRGGVGGGIGAGIVECPTAQPLWLPYIEVDDIWAATERAWELGARVMLEPREGPVGWRSVVTAPAVGEIAFWQPKR
jgi:uncharacterized protein